MKIKLKGDRFLIVIYVIKKIKSRCYQLVNCEISVNKKKLKRIAFLIVNCDISQKLESTIYESKRIATYEGKGILHLRKQINMM